MKTKESKGLSRLIAVSCTLAVLCVIVFSVPFFSVRAEAGETISEATESNDWYSVSDDGRELMVYLDNYLEGYSWRYGMDHDGLEIIYPYEDSSEDVRDDQNFRFEADPEFCGVINMTFVYIKDQDSQAAETRKLSVQLDKGLMTLN